MGREHLSVRKSSFAGAAALGLAAAFSAIAHAQTERDQALEEVIVTAQYREERLQEVPTSITALSADAIRLSGASTLKDLQNLVPNVQFAGESFSGNPKVVIRGLYINTRTTGLEPSFGIYVDGVFQGRPIAYNIDLVDIERIEYLRGPQGSLYGKNTISGAINVVTRKPGEEGEGLAVAELGNFGYQKYAATWRGPLSDRVGIKASVFQVKDDGYVDNIGPGGELANNDRVGGNVMLRFTPNEDFEVLWSMDAMSEDRGGVLRRGEQFATRWIGSVQCRGTASDRRRLRESFSAAGRSHAVPCQSELSAAGKAQPEGYEPDAQLSGRRLRPHVNYGLARCVRLVCR